ncbi:MAG: hypothetical protein AMJ92_03265 [candidate division Zixibacteria bacterium SM23_81]|nr:MAG: hypothetical protein AMJ92_03265 [candidate division Zixibacteria bacterium SM23_81]
MSYWSKLYAGFWMKAGKMPRTGQLPRPGLGNILDLGRHTLAPEESSHLTGACNGSCNLQNLLSSSSSRVGQNSSLVAS